MIQTAENLRTKENEIEQRIKDLGSHFGKYPIADGIVDIDKYLKSSTKILWIMKEPYESSEKKTGGWHLCKDMYSLLCINKIIKTPATKLELLVDHAILSNISADEAIYSISDKASENDKNRALDSFQSTAVINIKKFSGGASANSKELEEAYSFTKQILLDQIETYNPDIVICGYTLNYFNNSLNFREGIKKRLGMGNNHYFCLKNRLYINAYHPSNRTLSDFEYIDLILKAIDDWNSIYRDK